LLADVPLKESWSEVPVIDLSKFFHARYIRFPIWALWLKRFLRQWHPDVLHAHRINSAGWMAAASGFHPYVITPWGTDIFVQPQQSWVARLLARFTLRQADLVTCLSHAMEEQAIQYGALASTLRIVQFGVDMDIFKPGSATASTSIDLRSRYSLPDHARIVLSPRAVTPLYNLDIILQSIPIVRECFPDTIFIFLNYNTDPDYKKKLDAMSMALGVDEFIRWIPPVRSRDTMAELYHLSEVVISVPSTDGTPVSVTEAMACAKPVVATDLPPLREFITSGENGLLVPVGQVSPLAEAIIQLLEQPHKAIEYGQKANLVVAERANVDLEMQRVESIYYDLAALHRT
jgi:glycosyltransferase involved in cell wall biosynthesis